MIYNFIRFILAMFSYGLMMITGWSINGIENIDTTKISIGVYCHTSFWDGIIGLMIACVVRYQLSYNISFIMKDSITGPLPIWIQDILGMVLIKRGEGGSIDKIADRFNNKQGYCLLISPEGTRSKINRWHSGPFVLADKLNADIITYGLDFSNYRINVKKCENNLEKVKTILEKDSVPLYPRLTTLDVKKDLYTSPIDYLVFTVFLAGISIIIWEGGELPRILTFLAGISSFFYHKNHEQIFAQKMLDHMFAWSSMVAIFYDYTIRETTPYQNFSRFIAWSLCAFFKVKSCTGKYRECNNYRVYHSLFHLSMAVIAYVS